MGDWPDNSSQRRLQLRTVNNYSEQRIKSAPPGIRTQNLRIKSPLLCH